MNNSRLSKLRRFLFGYSTLEINEIVRDAERKTSQHLYNRWYQIYLDNPEVNCDGSINYERTRQRNIEVENKLGKL